MATQKQRKAKRHYSERISQVSDSEIPKRNDVEMYSKPTKKKILDHVVPHVTPQWYELGVKLLKEEQESHLDVIQSNHSGDNKKCCMEMFWYWLKTNTNANWQQLLDALQSPAVELPIVAAKLEKTLIETETMVVSKEEFQSYNNDVGKAFITLQTKLRVLVKCANFGDLRRACIAQMHNPGGAELSNAIVDRISATSNTDALLNVLVQTPYWSWIDVRLLETVVTASQNSLARELLDNYKAVVFSKQLLSLFPIAPNKEIKQKTCDKVITKIKNDPNNFTVADILEFQSQLERDIMGIPKGVCILNNVNTGSLEVHWYIPTHCIDAAYWNARAKRYQFYNLHLQYLKIGHYQVIYDPLDQTDVVVSAPSPSVNAVKDFIDHYYDYLLVNMDGHIVTKLMISQQLLNERIVTNTSNDYQKSYLILQHVRLMDTQTLESFGKMLLSDDNQKHIGKLLIDGLQSSLMKNTSSTPAMVHEDDNAAKYIEEKDKILATKNDLFDPPSVIKEFLNMKVNLHELLQLCDPLPLVRQCTSLLASSLHNIPVFNSEYRDELQEVKHTHELIQKLSMFMTWDNHSILSTIAKTSNIPEATMLLTQFANKIDSSQPLTSFPLPAPSHHMVPYDNSENTVLAIDLDLELHDCTLQHAIDARSLIQDQCQLTSHCLWLLAVSKTNTTTIFWMIPRNIAHLITATASALQCQDRFYRNGILQLAVYPGTIISTGRTTLNVEGLSFFNQTSVDSELKTPQIMSKLHKEVDVAIKTVQSISEQKHVTGMPPDFQSQVENLSVHLKQSKSLVASISLPEGSEYSEKQLRNLQEKNRRLQAKLESSQKEKDVYRSEISSELMVKDKQLTTLKEQNKLLIKRLRNTHDKSSVAVQQDQLIQKEWLGRGRYGEVYKFSYSNKLYAGKVVHKKLLSGHPNPSADQINKFMRNAETASAWFNINQHCNIELFHSVTQLTPDSPPILLTELIHENLNNYTDRMRGNLPITEQLNLCHDMAKGLQFLHNLNVIHGNLHGANVLVNQCCQAKIADYICPIIKGLNDSTTLQNTDYMSPECIKNEHAICQKSDIYSLGVLCLQVATQNLPLPNNSIEVAGIQRWKEQMDQITMNPLLPLIAQCFKLQVARPHINNICTEIVTIKENPQVTVSKFEEQGVIECAVDDKQTDGKKDPFMLLKRLLKAKSNLSIKVRHAKILFCGTAEAGNTSFINFLKNVKLHECKNVEQSITSKGVIVESKENKWIDLNNQLCIKKLIYQFYSGNAESKRTDMSLDNTTSTLSEETHVERMIASFANPDEGELSETWNILTLLDIGCQPELINMLSAINDCAAVTFVVLNSSEGVNCLDQVVDTMTTKKYRKYEVNYTKGYILKCLLSLIKESPGRKLYFPKLMQHNEHQKPIVSFVAEFSGPLNTPIPDVINALSKKLKCEYIDTLNSDKRLRIWNYDGELLITYNNRLNVSEKSQDEDCAAKTLRSKIFCEVLSQKVPYEIPCTWFILELQLRSEQKVCFSLNEIHTLANNILPDENVDIKEFLTFYHLLGVLLYFEVDSLKEFVITDPQWLYNNLKKLVTCNFAKNTILDDKLDEFRYMGIFHESLLSAFDLDTQGIQNKYFLNLLVHLKVCAPFIKSSDTYYMPTALPICKLCEFEKQSVLQENEFGRQMFYTHDQMRCFKVKPLLIQFDIHTIPRGMFCWIVVQLIEENPEWKLFNNILAPDHDTLYQFNNLVTFRMNNRTHYMSLFDKVYYLEMQVRTKNFQPSSAFFEALNAVNTAIKSICEKFDRCTSDLRYGFLCNCSTPPTEHLTLIPQNISILEPSTLFIPERADCGYKELRLEPSHKVWFTPLKEMLALMDENIQATIPSSSHQREKLHERPEMFDLTKIVIQKVKDKWEYIAEALRYDLATIKAIKDTCKGNPKDCCRELFKDWLTTNNGAKAGPKVWSTLFDVLKQVDEIASDITEDIIAEVKQLK